MPFRLLQSSVAQLGRAFFAALRAQIQPARLRALACVPILADTPVFVDGVMMSGVAALVLFIGVSIGLLYRRMHDKEERLTSRALKAESELRTLQTMTDDAVLVISADGMIREVNPGAEELFQQMIDGLIGRPFSEVIPHNLPLAELTRNGPASFQSESPQAGGKRLSLDVLLSQVVLAKSTTYLAIAHPTAETSGDVLAKPVRQACHDLNNHFTALLGNLSVILMSGDAEPAVQERVLTAKKTGLRAQQTVRRLHCLATGEDPDAVEPSPYTIVPMPFALPQIQVPAKISNRPRVLVVDDEEAIRQLVACALDGSGFDVATAGDGEAAVKLHAEALKANRPFRVVVTDLCLPGRFDGCEAVAKMRALEPDLQAIVSSGHDSDPIMRAFREHGFAGALAKPFEMGTLIRIVASFASGEQPVRRSA